MPPLTLAILTGGLVGTFNQSVRRNRARFPADFMFQLTKEEFDISKSQFVTSSWGGIRRALPYAFTEQGFAMLSSVEFRGCSLPQTQALHKLLYLLLIRRSPSQWTTGYACAELHLNAFQHTHIAGNDFD